ncbi:MAG: tRNA pseudouridine(38-40) synthase TruA, partial [Acetatifactor sp.]
REGGYIRFTFHGTGFLQNMVRIMVGTLLEVGCGRMTVEQVQAVLDNPDRQKAGPTAPAMGLCLISVDYD